MSVYPQSDRTMEQIEALQMQIGELERESNKQSSAGAGLEHRCQQEEDEVDALTKTIEMSEGEAARKREKLQELEKQKQRAHANSAEISGSKAELDTIYDEARKHRETAGESMRKLRSEYTERLHKSAKLQEMAKAMKRRISAGIETDLTDGQGAEKHQELRDANATLESEIAAEAKRASDKAMHLQAQISEQTEQNSELTQQAEMHRVESAKYMMLLKVQVPPSFPLSHLFLYTKLMSLRAEQDSEMQRVRHALEENAEFRDGVHSDHKNMTLFLQKAAMMQSGRA